MRIKYGDKVYVDYDVDVNLEVWSDGDDHLVCLTPAQASKLAEMLLTAVYKIEKRKANE